VLRRLATAKVKDSRAGPRHPARSHAVPSYSLFRQQPMYRGYDWLQTGIWQLRR
jgi:hypothetical protein